MESRRFLFTLIALGSVSLNGCGFFGQQPQVPFGQPPYGYPPQQLPPQEVPQQVPPFLPQGLSQASGGFQMPRIFINGREFIFPTSPLGMMNGLGQVPYAPSTTGAVQPGTVQPGAVQGTQPGYVLAGYDAYGQPQYVPAQGTTAGYAPGATTGYAPGTAPAGTPGAPVSSGTPSTGAVAPSPGVATSLLGVQSSADQITNQQNQQWTAIQQNEQTVRANRQQAQQTAQSNKQGEINGIVTQMNATTDATRRADLQKQLDAKNKEMTDLRAAQQKEIDQDTETLKQNRQKLKDQQTQQVNGEISTLQTQLKQKQDESAQLKTQLAANQAKDKELRDKIAASDAAIKTLTDKYNADEKARADAITTQRTQLNTDLHTLQGQLASAAADKKAGIQTQIDAKNKAIADLQTKSTTDAKTLKDKYDADLAKLQADGKARRDELQKLIDANAPLPQKQADADAMAQRLDQQIKAYQQRITAIANT